MDAQTLIDAAYLRHSNKEDPDALRRHLPDVLRTVLDLLLHGIDFEGEPKSSAASAARMLACMVATLEEKPPAYIDATRALMRRTEDVYERALGMLSFIAQSDPYVREILDQVTAGNLGVREALAKLDSLWHWSR